MGLRTETEIIQIADLETSQSGSSNLLSPRILVYIRAEIEIFPARTYTYNHRAKIKYSAKVNCYFVPSSSFSYSFLLFYRCKLFYFN